jgi:phospholipase D1/2
MAHFFDKIKDKFEEVFDKHESHETKAGEEPAPPSSKLNTEHRFSSFAPQSSGHAKWHVDGASYFWAVSVALEGRRHVELGRETPLAHS